ncbi:MAG: carboxypeptidase regulatory-like domain-containing protein [Pyrinomonadaceae bacterium]
MFRQLTKFFGGLFACAAILMFLTVAAQAQFRAGLQGTVTDSTGGVISGATVTLTSNETGRAQTTTTSDGGLYNFSNLAPGRYSLTVEQTNFKKQTVQNIEIAAEVVQGIDVVLQAGGVSEVVTVNDNGGGAALDTENANVQKSISTQEIRQLPQAGRDPFNLLRLAPGVLGDSARGSGNGNAVNLPNTPGPGGSNNAIFQSENQPQISAAGQRVTANNIQLDGVSVNSLQYGGAAVITPNQESVKEILISSSSFSAEDGRNSGAQIKVVSQNGTNQFHGSAFFKYDAPELNAFNKYYGNSVRPAVPTRVEQRYKQYGGSFGGPLYLPRFGEGGSPVCGGKDKLFFFVSYEGLRNNSNNPYQAFVETAQYRQQVINARPNGITAQAFQSSGIQPRIISIIPRTCAAVFGGDAVNRCRDVPGGLDLGSVTGTRGTYLPLGNGVGNANIGGGFDGVPDIVYALLSDPTQQRGNQFNVRIDYNLNSKNQIAFSSYVTKRSDLSVDVGSQSRPGSDVFDKPLTYVLTGIWISNLTSKTVNEFRTNFTRFTSNQV